MGIECSRGENVSTGSLRYTQLERAPLMLENAGMAVTC